MIPADKYKNIYVLASLAAVLIRAAMAVYLYRGGTDTFGTDGLLYHMEGLQVARQLAGGVPIHAVKYAYTWYTVFVALIYYLFGASRYIASFANIILTLFAAILLLKIALNHKCRFINAAIISLAFLYFPNLFLWTSDSRKEALLIFLCFLCWYSIQRFVTRSESEKTVTASSFARIVFVCLLMWLCTLIRIYMFLPVAAGILASQCVSYRKYRRPISVVFIVAAAVSVFIICTKTVYPLLDEYHAITFPDAADDLGEDISNKIGTIGLLASNRNILTAAYNYFVLPYPGNTGIADIKGNGTLNLIVSLDMIAWYLCLLLTPTGIYSAIKKRDSFPIGVLAFLACYIVINVLVVENVADTIYRYRSVIVGMSLLFIDWNVISRLAKRSEALFNYLFFTD